MKLLNTRLLFEPINWAIVLLMVIIAGVFGHYVLALFDQSPAKPQLSTVPLGYATPSGE